MVALKHKTIARVKCTPSPHTEEIKTALSWQERHGRKNGSFFSTTAAFVVIVSLLGYVVHCKALSVVRGVVVVGFNEAAI